MPDFLRELKGFDVEDKVRAELADVLDDLTADARLDVFAATKRLEELLAAAALGVDVSWSLRHNRYVIASWAFDGAERASAAVVRVLVAAARFLVELGALAASVFVQGLLPLSDEDA